MSRSDWNFENSSANESALRPLCEQVDKYFPLPVNAYYRYFAASPDVYLAHEIGRYYRGAHVPTSGSDDVSRYLLEEYLPEGSTRYHHLVYIRDVTCADSTGCVVTYAHELQHIVQHSLPKLVKVNSILREVIQDFDPSATEIDIPAEVDANIVSKRVAEAICGLKAVREFAEERVRFMLKTGDRDQIVRWKFFLDTPSSTPYDFEKETLSLVEKYNGRIAFDIDMSAPDWWKGAMDDFPAGSY
jgi:hypothetical protein